MRNLILRLIGIMSCSDFAQSSKQLQQGYCKRATIIKCTSFILLGYFFAGASLQLSAQNYIALSNPDMNVDVGENVPVIVTYNSDQPAYVLVRFKDASNNNLKQDFQQITAGEGSTTLNLVAPSAAGSDYSYHAQLLALDWGGLAENSYGEVAVGNSSPLPAQNNSINFVDPPSQVKAGESTEVRIRYDTSENAYVLVRFRNSSNNNLEQDFEEVPAGSGERTFYIKAPSEPGNNYNLHAQLMNLGWGGIDEAIHNNVSVELDQPQQENNTLALINPPSQVEAGENVEISVSYSVNENAYLLVRFRDANNNNLKQDFAEVAAGTDERTFIVKAPGEPGNNYNIHVQLMNLDWGGLEEDVYNNVNVGLSQPPQPPQPPLQGSNTLQFVNTSNAPLNFGDIRDLTIQYNIDQDSRQGTRMGLNWLDLRAGQGTITIPLTIDLIRPSDDNYIRALLFEYESWTSRPITSIPSFNVGKGDGTMIYRGQPYLYNNDQNLLFQEDLGGGYHTNWFVNNNWIGPIKARFSNAGQEAWIDWDYDEDNINNFDLVNPHAEFDIKIQKYSWHGSRGYPTQINNISNSLNCFFEGNWSDNSEGRTFVNMTAWIYNAPIIVATEEESTPKSDIIVHTWDNSGDIAARYAANDEDEYEVLESLTSGGISYHVLKRNTGGYGEVIEKLLIRDANSESPSISNEWWLHGLEWTWVGQSSDFGIQDSRGKLTMTSYGIPDIEANNRVKGINSIEDLNGMEVYPSPFAENFELMFYLNSASTVTAELTNITGEKVKTILSGEYLSEGYYADNVNTAKLAPGIYVLRLNTPGGVIAKRIVKY